MARLTFCSGCEFGNHAEHHRVVQAVPEGMLGGAVCPCKGECEDEPGRTERREQLLGGAGLLRLLRKAR